MVVRSLVVGAGGFLKQIVSEEERAFGAVRFAPLPSVAGAVAEVALALSRVGVAAEQPLVDPDLATANAAFDEIQRVSGGDPLIVHFSGHGVVCDDDLYLAVLGSEMDELPATALNTTELIRRIEHSKRAGHALFLLDVCGGGQALASQLARRLSGAGRKAWVIAACAADEATHGARFSLATAAVLDRLARGWLDLSPALEHVPVDTLAAEIDRELARTARAGGWVGQAVVRTPHEEAVLEAPPFFRNPSHAGDAASRFLSRTEAALRQFAIESDPGLDLIHFASRAAGTSRTDTCLFSGRTEQLRRIEAWLDNADGNRERLLVVTGGPGSGKSALLGVTVCVTHPALAPLRRHIVTRVRGFRPTPSAIVLAVHARQLSTQQITDSLLRQLAAQRGDHLLNQGRADAADSPTDLRLADPGRLMDELRALGAPVVVILDALDEATDPGSILEQLLLPLSDTDEIRQIPKCRVMIGTRPWWDTLPGLQVAVTSRPESLLDLDAQSRESLAADLAEYLGDVLYPDYPESVARTIARRLARFEHGAFLIAVLYADHLLSEAAAARRTTERQAAANLPGNITQMFDLHLTSLAQANPWVRPVLTVLGQAQGQGMPLDLVHAAALALAPTAGDRALLPGIQDTRDALTQAAFYLRTVADTDGRLLYRYFHQALTDHIAPTADPVAIHRALLAAVPASAAGAPNWELAHPYLKRHLASHAAGSGPEAVDQLLADPLFLLHTEPDELTPHLRHAMTARALEHANIYRTTTAHHPHRRDPAARRSLLALDAAAWGNPRLAATIAATPLGHRTTPTTPWWATSHTADPARLHTLTEDSGPACAVTTTTVAGTPVAVAAHGTRAVVWDLTTGQQLRVFTGHGGPVRAVTTATVDGRRVGITAAGWRMIVWDLTTGQQLRTFSVPRNRDSTVTAVASATWGGQPVVVTAVGARVIVWDAATGRELRSHSQPGRVHAVATVVVGGRPVVVAAVGEGAVVRDLATGSLLCEVEGHGGPVDGVATAALDGHPVVVTTAGSSMAVWDVATGRRLHGLSLPGEVRAVATVVVGGHPAVVAAVGEGAVVRDLATGEQVYGFKGRSGPVDAVATLAVDGRPLMVTAAGRSVAVWDLAVDQSLHAAPARGGHSGPVNAAALITLDEGPAVVTVAEEQQVIVWDLASGRQLSTFADGGGRVKAVATLTVDGRPVAVTAAGRSVTAWDLGSRTRLRVLSHYALRPHGVATATVDGRPVAVVASGDRTVIVWDLMTGELLRTLAGHTGLVNVVATVVVDGRPLAVSSAGDWRVIVWDLATGGRLQTLTSDTGPVNAVATTRIGQRPVIVTAGRQSVVVWDLGTGEQLRLLTGHTGPVRAVAATLVDGHPVAVTAGDDQRVITWDLGTGQPLHTPLSLPGRGTVVAVAQDHLLLGYGPDIACLSWAAARRTAPRPA
ncbi:AAA family ATPase [Kitasatospora sp. NPDC002227]|uniref:AAA family ATPase n=1 Tax=Kitasatospora sp. NPDC002227 TaxID=3154773 RepID=UPI003331CFE2